MQAWYVSSVGCCYFGLECHVVRVKGRPITAQQTSVSAASWYKPKGTMEQKVFRIVTDRDSLCQNVYVYVGTGPDSMFAAAAKCGEHVIMR
ncbi:hypothetical protein JK2ML_0448 [Mycobacterium leprae Kyoto-2]|uniref:Uncharacterized protein n=3 Tax=Mycobacterium leprae TaxID=1769 RepID=Q7AQJ2_MYCLE|nr:hypothetical protein DIJ64_02400 [Mycobacterium leprae]OAR20613.1 hypothetical protein A8144_10000 [Mycobacterium leprae 3125609]OAX70822.1 hypothetical protein A3216_09780 [Mycobacterium leprae 7935681]CAR70541.1 hypothetical protein MLBr00448 [Mycobacterium leprae Br4923]BBC16566.1 hypothetical protein JK2ML_0448 [Mycobacterium leprae Kyoto-2]